MRPRREYKIDVADIIRGMNEMEERDGMFSSIFSQPWQGDWDWVSSTTSAPAPAPQPPKALSAFASSSSPAPKAEVVRDREISVDEARDINLLDAMLRHRVRCSFMDIDQDWLNENCEGLYCIWDNERIGFELDDDYVLFRMKFHAA